MNMPRDRIPRPAVGGEAGSFNNILGPMVRHPDPIKPVVVGYPTMREIQKRFWHKRATEGKAVFELQQKARPLVRSSAGGASGGLVFRQVWKKDG